MCVWQVFFFLRSNFLSLFILVVWLFYHFFNFPLALNAVCSFAIFPKNIYTVNERVLPETHIYNLMYHPFHFIFSISFLVFVMICRYTVAILCLCAFFISRFFYFPCSFSASPSLCCRVRRVSARLKHWCTQHLVFLLTQRKMAFRVHAGEQTNEAIWQSSMARMV